MEAQTLSLTDEQPMEDSHPSPASTVPTQSVSWIGLEAFCPDAAAKAIVPCLATHRVLCLCVCVCVYAHGIVSIHASMLCIVFVILFLV